MVGEIRICTAGKKEADARQARLLEILDKISYPSMEFTLNRVEGEEGAQFFLTLRKQKPVDADRPTERLYELQYYSLAVNGLETPTDLVRGIFEHIQMIELHEVAEHFRFEDRKVFDPHRPVAQSVRAADS